MPTPTKGKKKKGKNKSEKKRKIDSAAGPSAVDEEEEESVVPMSVDEDVSDYELDDDVDVLYEKLNFSQSAISSLSETLAGEEERTTNKALFLQVALTYSPSSLSKLSWLKIDANNDFTASCVHGMSSSNSSFPSELQEPQNLRNYGCAVWKSNIVLAGGLLEVDGFPSEVTNKVFIYDTISEKWDQLPPMIAKRSKDPILVAADDKIFVFDGIPQHDDLYDDADNENQAKERLMKLWAEYYDPRSQSWERFPKYPSTDFLRYPSLGFHAVYAKKSLILFWLAKSHVISFNYITFEWEKYDVHNSITKGPIWSFNVVLLDHFLFWHNYGTIYAHDLEAGLTLPIYTFNYIRELFGPVWDYCPSYLVHLGNGELCLFWWTETHTLRHNTFLLRIGRGGGEPILHLVSHRKGFIGTTMAYIDIALELSY